MGRRPAGPPELTAHHDCEFREMLDHVGDKWSLLVIVMLEQRPTQRARFSELKRSSPGISQRMLTATLRSLERDGLLTRDVYAEVPPRRVRADAAGQGIHAARSRTRQLAPGTLGVDQVRTRHIRTPVSQFQGLAGPAHRREVTTFGFGVDEARSRARGVNLEPEP